jgi:hypothetical protein
VAEKLKHKVPEGFNHLRKSLEEIWNTQLFFAEYNSDVVKIVTDFANLEFWQHLVHFLNKNRIKNEKPVDTSDMSKFFMVCLLPEKSRKHVEESVSVPWT